MSASREPPRKEFLGKEAASRIAPEESATGLLSRLLDDATALVRNEIALAKAEFQQALSNTKTAAGSFALGGAVVVAGCLTLVAAAILALAKIMQPWAAALIIGALLVLVGVVMLMAAKKSLGGPVMRLDQTQKSLRADAAVVTRRTT